MAHSRDSKESKDDEVRRLQPEKEPPSITGQRQYRKVKNLEKQVHPTSSREVHQLAQNAPTNKSRIQNLFLKQGASIAVSMAGTQQVV